MINKLETYSWDAAEHLETQEDIAAYYEAAFEDGDPALVLAALGDIARSKRMAHIARETGLPTYVIHPREPMGYPSTSSTDSE